jgi:hypothetical protein
LVKCGIRSAECGIMQRHLLYFIPHSKFGIPNSVWGLDPDNCIMYKLYINSLPSRFAERTAEDPCSNIFHPEG